MCIRDRRYKGKNIADVLAMTVSEALDFFSAIPKLQRRLQLIDDVGLGYIRLGQPATTLSGGEAQRVKLATELSRRSNGRTLYILDEPTTGLHLADISKLLLILERLVDSGNTVVVIEHNMDVLKRADYLIDLGPEGGEGGGRVVAAGTPEEVAASDSSYTGFWLRQFLKQPAEKASSMQRARFADIDNCSHGILDQVNTGGFGKMAHFFGKLRQYIHKRTPSTIIFGRSSPVHR